MPIVAQAASESGSGIEPWLFVVVALLTIGGSLGGVVLGSRLDRRARREEREASERAELRKDASEILGTARVVLTAMEPQQYARWASEEPFAEVEKRRREADEVRPKLAALAVRWPDATPELNAVERHLGITPTRLVILIQTVLGPDPFTEMLNERKADHEAVTAALDRAIGKPADRDQLEQT